MFLARPPDAKGGLLHGHCRDGFVMFSSRTALISLDSPVLLIRCRPLPTPGQYTQSWCSELLHGSRAEHPCAGSQESRISVPAMSGRLPSWNSSYIPECVLL